MFSSGLIAKSEMNVVFLIVLVIYFIFYFFWFSSGLIVESKMNVPNGFCEHGLLAIVG